MKTLYVMKVGTTFPATLERHGDFDQWTSAALGDIAVPVAVVDVERGESLPDVGTCAGAVVTGSHSMVTDNLPWSLALEEWLKKLLRAEIPIFGICYGHQLLARAGGGEVGFHPRGKEVGTVRIHLTENHLGDPIFTGLPPTFAVHATHAQSVLALPPGAIHLAANGYEPHHAFRIGPSAWGVQFHPEYNAAIMRSYVEQQSDALKALGRDVQAVLAAVTETPAATALYRNFSNLIATGTAGTRT